MIHGLGQLGFERYLENLNLYYKKYKEVAKQSEKPGEEGKREDDEEQKEEKQASQDGGKHSKMDESNS